MTKNHEMSKKFIKIYLFLFSHYFYYSNIIPADNNFALCAPAEIVNGAKGGYISRYGISK